MGDAVVRRLLFVDDDHLMLRSLQRVMKGSGCDIVLARSAEEGIQTLEGDTGFQVVCSDHGLPGASGVDFLEVVKERWPRIQRVMLTGTADLSAIEAAVNRCEVFRFINKPSDASHIARILLAAFDQHRVYDENDRLHHLVEQQNEHLRAQALLLEAKVAERTHLLARAKREWELTFDAIDLPVAILASDWTVRRANLTYARNADTDVRQLIGGRCFEKLFKRTEPCAGCPVAAAVAQGEPCSAEISAPGDRTFGVHAFPSQSEGLAGVVCVYRDITDEKRLQQQAQVSARMAALGQLAGGVAHEINNPLGAILAFAQVMLREGGRSADDLESLQLIEQSARRCKHVVESMLKFSRRTKPIRTLADVNEPVAEALVLFNALLKTRPKATLVRDMPENLPAVLIDGNQVQQVVLNLLQNALDALPCGAGTITLTTGVEGERVIVSVRDSGSGIPPDVLPHIFEPLYTTKPAGQGTGFGLSIVYGIVESHGGRIDVDSKLGSGTLFTIRLPVAAGVGSSAGRLGSDGPITEIGEVAL